MSGIAKSMNDAAGTGFRGRLARLGTMLGLGLLVVQPIAAEAATLSGIGSAVLRKLDIGQPEAARPDRSVALERPVAKPAGDVRFKALFDDWRKLDTMSRGVIAVPSTKPVEGVALTSIFGVRSDPFRGGAAMHAGIDLAGPIGTPIYATADGIVDRAGWSNGYGNLVEINHGKGIQTRFGHLSRILVAPNTRVRRGDMIALMGSTGRSTGSHLHYEVRLDGRAVNPLPFLRSSEYVMAMQQRTSATQLALGGPED